VLGDHVQLGDGEAVSSRAGTHTACFLPGESDVMGEMWLEINTTGTDLENVTGVIFRNCVVTIRASQTTLDGGLLWGDARRGSLCNPHRDQQGRYNHQQKCFSRFHGIPPKTLGLMTIRKFRLGFWFASDFSSRTLVACGLRRENEHPGETAQPYSVRI
jgi:hypothetical protein